jgi:hypothetical protein
MLRFSVNVRYTAVPACLSPYSLNGETGVAAQFLLGLRKRCHHPKRPLSYSLVAV